ncbi:helix-turn-helix transcriptional regulator [Actinoplanes bogorensis]|uniref:Helix-turn-helix transcriptional regulator n=1 Tax=Paractinoplanes bogorensis TaxID=1610840 RepID=A0ABS5YP15_9ACTN|nr:helix-turn-helix transcriptional regulator [Actinoplanes bogorensis]MBU2665056.1 helix-turn-helix transcriptional regulator [Actinoplanes bogorensis]
MSRPQNRLAALGEFLRLRRGAFDPGQLPLPSYGRRRVPGIRREELALMAGVSVSYYTRIEQGAVTASESVLEAIATALRLDQQDRAQMFRLARSEHAPAEPEQLTGTLQLILRTLHEVPAGVLGRSMNMLGWNRLAHALFADHLPFETPWATEGTLSWARLLFLDDKCRGRFARWEMQAQDMVGRLRAAQARHPDDPALASVVADLRAASPEFAELWAAHPVRDHSLGDVYLAHPALGDLQLRDTVLRPAEEDDQLLILFHAEPGSDSERKLAELRRSLEQR